MGKYDEFLNNVRFLNGEYLPEPLWTYFEAGQAHNYLLLGEREKIWSTIDWFLNNHTSPGLYSYHEGYGNDNLLWQRVRGWDDYYIVTPHGWTASEFFLLLRDCLAREEGDKMIIGSGIPEDWMMSEFKVTGMPTYFGKLSFKYEPKCRKLTTYMENHPAGGIISDLPGEVNVEIVSEDF